LATFSVDGAPREALASRSKSEPRRKTEIILLPLTLAPARLGILSQCLTIVNTLYIRSVESGQSTSWGFTENVRNYGLLGSMGTVVDCYDNSPMESFWGSMQIELLNRQRWTTVVELSVAMADYIENFYNLSRRHSSLDYFTPDEFENLQLKETQASLA